MDKFGVCRYDFDSYNSKLTELQQFDTYEEAYDCYMTKLAEYEHYPYGLDNTLWYVWIENGRIIQFEQLSMRTKCRIVKVK